MQGVFVDTGAWYALVDRNDPDHQEVVSKLQEHKARLVTSNFIIDETLTLMRCRLNWEIAHAFGAKMREGMLSRIARISSADEDASWEIFTRHHDQAFSFTDCTSFALMARLNIETAIAIDNDFKAYGFNCLP